MSRAPLSAVAIGVAALAATFALPPASADFPWDEAGDVVWCADIASRTLREAIDANVDHYGRSITANYYSLKCKLRTHAPIVINGDPTTTDRVKLLTDYGIIEGTGTAADPYVIQGWSIVRSQHVKLYTPLSDDATVVALPLPATAITPVTDWGIQLIHVKKHYIVDGVHVEGFRCDGACNANYPFRGAIKIVAAPGAFEDHGLHVTVRGSALVENDQGVHATDAALQGCDNCPTRGLVSITDNTITAQGYGIWTYTWRHAVSITGNRVEPISIPTPYSSHGSTALQIATAREGDISNNDLRGSWTGIALSWAPIVSGSGNVICARVPYYGTPGQIGYTTVGGCGF